MRGEGYYFIFYGKFIETCVLVVFGSFVLGFSVGGGFFIFLIFILGWFFICFEELEVDE